MFWEKEKVEFSRVKSVAENICEQYLVKNTIRDFNGKYIVKTQLREQLKS